MFTKVLFVLVLDALLFGLFAFCQERECNGQIADNLNATRGKWQDPNDPNSNTIIYYLDCCKGYKLLGYNLLSCNTTNGEWIYSGRCVISETNPPSSETCGQLPQLRHGYFTRGCSHLGHSRDVGCFPGYQYNGNGSTITCTSQGWTSIGACVKGIFSLFLKIIFHLNLKVRWK